ncbi:hypothetical protein [Halomontanus rarus]|uniref:hypothetical protein n=1 Tax=Halomontanus rarus TaxID=3034020 RepID=UPI001A99D769
MRRRTLLTAGGGIVGLGGLVGAHQRRRLSRWSDRDALHSALEVERLPAVLELVAGRR